MPYEFPTLYQTTLAFNRLIGRTKGKWRSHKGPTQFRELVRQHEDLNARIASFKQQLGAAPERRGRRNFPDQTTQLGRDILDHARELIAHVSGADSKNVTFYHTSGTGTGEPLIYLNALYNNYVKGRFHVLRFGSFGDRIRLQADAAHANTKLLDADYGSAPTEKELKRHFRECADDGDTIAFTHLETSTAAQIDPEKTIRTIAKIYREKGLHSPVFIVDATSSPGFDIRSLKAAGIKVAVYQGSAKPVTSEALEGIVYSTAEAEKEFKQRFEAVCSAQQEHDREADVQEKKSGKRVPRLPMPPLYFRHTDEQQAQEKDGRARFTQPVHHFWGIANNLLHLLRSGLYTNPANMTELSHAALEHMDKKRSLVQKYVEKSLKVLGFERFSNAPSNMLLSVKRPHWLADPQELLQVANNRYGVPFQVGYAGATPGLWMTSIDPDVQSQNDIFRINTYYVDDPKREIGVAHSLIKSAAYVAKKHGQLDKAKAKQLEEIRRNALAEARALTKSR